MTYEQFRVKYEGKGVDFDNYYGFQCMDLYRQYCKEVLDVPQSPSVNGAKDVWNTYLTQYFDRFDNNPSAVPEKGDIIIWGVGVGTYGHIAIFDNGDVNKFKSFDQNWPVGSLCHLQDHNYTGVLGWLRKKAIDVPPPPQTALKIDLGGLQTPLETYGVIEIDTLKSKLLAKDTDIKSKQGEIEVMDARIDDLDLEISRRGLKINETRTIVLGKGWPWVKVKKIKELLG